MSSPPAWPAAVFFSQSTRSGRAEGIKNQKAERTSRRYMCSPYEHVNPSSLLEDRCSRCAARWICPADTCFGRVDTAGSPPPVQTWCHRSGRRIQLVRHRDDEARTHFLALCQRPLLFMLHHISSHTPRIACKCRDDITRLSLSLSLVLSFFCLFFWIEIISFISPFLFLPSFFCFTYIPSPTFVLSSLSFLLYFLPCARNRLISRAKF